MRWLKQTLSIVLVLAAAGVILSTAFGDHAGDYGRVSLPQGGTLHLPKGEVLVYFKQQGQDQSDSAGGLAFQVSPVGGGAPLAVSSPNGQVSDISVTRAETIGEVGALGKFNVPSSGEYVVSGSSSLAPGASYLEFGTNAGHAVLNRWKLIAGLVLGALLLTIIPVPRSGRRWGEADEPTGWSSNPRAPYAG
jgi:hypothetical protein